MTSDMQHIISTLLENISNLLNTTIYPGTNLSISTIYFYIVLILLAIAVVRWFLGLWVVGDNNTSVGTGGNNKKIKVSDDRKGDTL